MSEIVPRAAPGTLKAPGELRPLTLPERAALEENDADNALRLLSEFGEDLLYVVNRGWAVWDGTRYAFTAGELRAFAIASKLRGQLELEAEWLRENANIPDWMVETFFAKPTGMKAALELAAKHGIQPYDGAVRLLRAKVASDRAKHAITCGNVERIKKALEYCQHMSSATQTHLDADPLAFVCVTGQVDLWAASRTRPGEVPTVAERAAWHGPTDRSKLPTRASMVTYDPAAECPEYDAFLELIVPDPVDRAALGRCLGYLLSGDNPEAACMILRGPGGNGKTTLLGALEAVMGTEDGYTASCDIDMFMVTPPKPTGGHNADEMDLPGARVLIGTEPAPTDTFSLKKIKSLTGGDTKKVRAAYQPDAVRFKPRGVPLLSCNKTPRIADDDPGTRRRMIFIPLEVNLKELPPEKRRPQHEVDAALAEEAPGILNRLIDGWRDYKRHKGLALPAHWLALRDTLMEDADPVGMFLTENTEKDDNARLRRSDFNRVFKAWSEEEGAATWSGRAVNGAMKEKGFRTIRVMGQEYWPGLRWQGTAFDLVERATGTRPHEPPAPPGASQPPPF